MINDTYDPKQLMKDNTNPLDIIINGNNLLHIASIKGDEEYINYILKEYPETYKISNYNGDTFIMLFIQFGNYNLTKKYLKLYPDLINFINYDKRNILFYSFDNYDFLEWLINNTKIDVNKKDTDGLSALIFYIYNRIIDNKISKEKYIKIISLLIQKYDNKLLLNDIDILLTESNIDLNKYIDIIYIIFNKIPKDILKEQFKTNYSAILIKAIFKNSNLELIELIIKNGININYSGDDQCCLPLNLALQKNNVNLIILLLKYNADVNITNTKINTPLHIAVKLLYLNRITVKTFQILIDYDDSNLNITNLLGYSIFDFLVKYKLWKKIILTKKCINFNNTYLIKYIVNSDLPDFYNLIIKENLNEIKKKNNIKYSQTSEVQLIKKQLIEHILDNNKNEGVEFKTINNPEIEKTNIGTFMTSDLDVNLYYLIILKKYDNVFIPFQYFNKNKYITDIQNIQSYSYSTTQLSKLTNSFIKKCATDFYRLMPYNIIWTNQNINYFCKDFHIYFNKILNNKKIRYVFWHIKIIITPTTGHVNLLLYDKKLNSFYHFEPHGNGNSYIDYDIFYLVLKKKLKNSLSNFKYLKPSDFMQYNPQLLSYENNLITKRYNDPGGYCVAWCCWFLELVLNNPNIDVKELIKLSINKIINTNKQKNHKNNNNIGFSGDMTEDNTNIVEFIRNYAKKIFTRRSNFLLNNTFPKKYIYALHYSDDIYDKLLEIINSNFKQIYKQHGF